MLVDSHCHLDRLKMDKTPGLTIADVVREAAECGVGKMLCVGIDMHNAEAVKQIAETYPNVYASVGVHPLDVREMITPEELISAASHSRVVAIGETGLDYYYSQESKAVQQESLVMHLQVASQLQLPVIIHTREAREDTLALMREHASRDHAGVMHCFTETWEMAKAAIDMGFYISFSGIVTFRNAAELQEVARKVPLDRMLVETDSPYLAPIPHRGKPNFPKYTREVAEFLAQLKGISYVELADQTTANFHRLFSKAA